jgi:hypothetical protein
MLRRPPTIPQGVNLRFPWLNYTEDIFPVHIGGMEFSLSHLPDNTIHVSGFCGEDAGIVKLNIVSQVDFVLCQMFQINKILMLLQHVLIE